MAGRRPDLQAMLRQTWRAAQEMGPIRRRAAVASLGWTVVVVGYAIGFFAASQSRGTVFLDGAFFLVTLALPLILVWTAAYLAEELARQRDMIAGLAELVGPLIGALGAARQSLERHGPASPEEIRKAVQGAVMVGRAPDVTPALERIAAGQAEIEAMLRALAEQASRPAPAAPAPAAPVAVEPVPAPPLPRTRVAAALEAPGEAEPELPMLGEGAPQEALGWADIVRALNFPRDADDHEGFRALRSALRHRSLAQMLQAAEDVLTLLSQEGVYVDDLAMEPAAPDAWRRFMDGARGAAADEMGAVRDAEALEAARGLMKQDTIFRDTALFFQRRFDVVLNEVARGADDGQIAELADTRSGRAFQLMARASGSFD